MKRIPRRSYTEQYQQKTVRLASKVEPAEAVRRLEMPVKTLNKLDEVVALREEAVFRREQTGTGNRAGTREPAVADRERAAKGGARDPKKAAAYFAKESL